jgi:hypothetical protein
VHMVGVYIHGLTDRSKRETLSTVLNMVRESGILEDDSQGKCMQSN